MTVITNENFKKKFPEIKKSLENAKFVGIDLEFSALYPLRNYSPSLFDTPTERYIKLRRNLDQVVPVQIGLTAFSFDPDKNNYHGNVYNFYIIPASFTTINRSFYFQSDTLNFLKLHGFDFNKYVYSGIPFINKDQETEFRKKLKTNELMSSQASCRNELEEIIEKEGETVRNWYNKAKDGDKLSIPKLYESNKYNIEMLYFIHKNFRTRFKNIWTNVENDQFVIQKVTSGEYKILDSESNLEENLVIDLLGFTNVFRILTTLKKPIVGHNLLQDILLMINSFETSLPHSYSSFKDLAISLFPTIFDTKVISYEMRSFVSGRKTVYFKNGSGRHLALNSPAIEIMGETSYGKFHEAGWDSFCAGYIFIRLAHLNVYNHYPKSKKFVSGELIAGLSKWKNCVNVIRGAVSSIKIDGEDPNSTRPPYLVIESVKNGSLNIPQLTSLLSSFGFVEVRKFPHHNRRALIAVDNFGNARRILNNLKSHNEFQIRQYSALKHSPVVRAFLLSGITVSGALLIWLAQSIMKK
ncbi:hypothetical protein NQ317_011649 [Molorchus minor]|uniref:Uncharacterized protein n=1 Tax=Molorchus minor TaxID=1323400 RepID=A0ABQ9K157_9CUCU|nr:hypothetical protein NQ317_011649 [Molorchus minor]